MDPQGPAVRELSAHGATPSRVGRDGRLELAFESRGGRTVLTARRFALPLQFLEPFDLADGTPCATLLNPTGGVLAGDRLTTRLRLGPGAHVCVTTPSATRVYRSDGPRSALETQIEIAPGAVLEHLPDHLIPHPGADLEQSLSVDVAEAGRAIVWDAFALGRVARGEAWRFRRLAGEVAIRAAGRLVFLERFRLEPEKEALDPAAGFSYVGTLVCVGPADFDWRGLALELASRPSPEGARVGASPLAARGLAVRVLAARAPALAVAFDGLWTAVRGAVLGRGRVALRQP
jgi:urease accessory protein